MAIPIIITKKIPMPVAIGISTDKSAMAGTPV
jgi:hypothetical protein